MVPDLRPFGELFEEPTRNGLNRPQAVRGAGVKMVNMGELFAHPRIHNTPMDRVPLAGAEMARSLLKAGDLLFARQSLVLEGAGKCSLFVGDDEPVTFESHVTRVRLDPNKADSAFYFYYLQSPHGRAAIRSIVEQGAGASGIRGSDLAGLSVSWFPPPVQRAIAQALGALDDKIELNRRMSETLESMARAIFDSWLDRERPSRVPTADLLAKGVLEIGDGYRARNDELGSPGLPFIRAGNLQAGIQAQGAEVLRQASADKAGKKASRVGDVAFTSKGTIGRFARVSQHTPKCVYSPQVCYWRSLDTTALHPAVLYAWMTSQDLASQIEAVSGQTDMALYVSLSDQRRMDMPRFPGSQSEICKHLSALYSRQDNANAESRVLAAIRDALLPRLISGMVRVTN